ncbi:MAG: YafY family transcriptional regulator [Betaproteobacteria bacterium]|nr:MAG: YafY family transcriptional regulator [Betaproteobacteria bacterium]
MDRTERFYRIDRLLRDNRVVTIDRFLDDLSVSRATFKRDLEYMRDRLNAPIEWDREAGGYRFVEQHSGAPEYELPGLWFNESEILALLSMESLLKEIEPGLLGPRLEPLKARLSSLIESTSHSADEVRKRIRVLHMGSRSRDIRFFEQIALALMNRRRLHLDYFVRSRDELTHRDVSPQRLVHYRDNWYLDAWCHSAEAVRSFALDAVEGARVLDESAIEVPEDDLDRLLGAGYGIFSGEKVQWAKLRFSSQRARWVAAEEWHPQQRSSFDEAGRYILEVPYSQDPELMMDILKHGAEVEVLSPPELRERVALQLSAAAHQYRA